MDARIQAETERQFARQFHRDAIATRLGLIVFEDDHVLAERALTCAGVEAALEIGARGSPRRTGTQRRYRLRVIGGAAVNGKLLDIAESALFQEAAAEVRETLRRYWAKGGPADWKYPLQETPEWWWLLGPEEPAFRNIGDLIFGRDRQRQATRVAGKLLRAISLDPRLAAGLLHAWNLTYCRPPLPAPELKQTFDRIAYREAERLERLHEKRAAA